MSELRPCIYDPSTDAFVDIKTLEPVTTTDGRKCRPEWLGNVDIVGILITRKSLALLCEEMGL